MNSKRIDISKLSKIGIFSALSVVLYFLRFPLPIFPEFLKIQFSALPLVIIGYTLGPIEGMIALVIKTLVCLPFTSTMYVGDLADFLICTSYILTTSLMYKANKTKKSAAISLFVGSVFWLIMAMLANYFILIPFFINVMLKGNVAGFVGMCSVIPGITIDNYRLYYLLYAAIPFNLIITTAVSLVTFVVYKRISKILSRY